MPLGKTWLQTQTDLATKINFRRDIEGLRGLAILLVVAFHANIPGLSGGFIGVDVFFVVSGYVITTIIFDELGMTGRLDLVRFYARRARRLLPAAALALLATIVASSLILSPIERPPFAKTALSTALYVSNLWFQRQASSYFGQDASENPLLHTWSLSVEEQFYLLWPTAIALTFWFCKSKRIVVLVLFGITITSLALCFSSASAAAENGRFFSAPARAWQFGVGAIASLISAAWAERLSWLKRSLGICGILAVVGVAVLTTSGTAFPNVVALLPVLGTAAILISGAPGPNAVNADEVSDPAHQERESEGSRTSDQRRGRSIATLSATRILELPVLQWIGARSYSWYLWHWPVLVLASIELPALGLPARAAFALASLGIASLSYAFVENPIRKSRLVAKSRWVTLAAAAGLTVAVASISYLAKASADTASRTPIELRIAAARSSSPQALEQSGCFLDFADTRLPDCEFGDVASPTTIVLFGDSHAAQWFSAFEAVAVKQNWRLIAFTKAGCPTVRVSVMLWPSSKPYRECAVWREAVLQRIAALHPAVVILGDSDGHVTRADGRGSTRLSLQQWQDGIRSTLDVIQAGGRTHAVILHDAPAPPFDVPKCLSRADARGLPPTSCAAPRSTASSEVVFQAVQQAVTLRPEVTLMDLTNSFCDAAACPPIRDGIIIYRNPGHITDQFARSLAPIIAAQLVPLVSGAKG